MPVVELATPSIHPGIPRSHRYAPSRPLTLREGGVRLPPCHTRAPPSYLRAIHVIPSEARNLPSPSMGEG